MRRILMTTEKMISAIGGKGRLVAARLLPGKEVMEGITELIKTNGVKSGTITAIGSLRSAKVIWAGSMEFGDNPMDVAVFHEMEGPVELGIGHGIFGRDDAGEVVIHFHALVMDKDGNMRCGNLFPGSAPVLATVEVTIEEFEGLELKPTPDPVWKHTFLHPRRTD
jgi:predicted DNA-binding protein with PD1-like motif